MRLDVMVNTMLDVIRDNKLMVEGGEQCRPCLHVDDLCLAYSECLENPNSNSKIYNVTNENYSVNQVVDHKASRARGRNSLPTRIRPEVISSALIKKDLGLKFRKK